MLHINTYVASFVIFNLNHAESLGNMYPTLCIQQQTGSNSVAGNMLLVRAVV